MALTVEQRRKQSRDLIRRYQVDPVFWVKTVFGDNIIKAQKSRGINVRTETGLTQQQESALRQWGSLIEAKRNLRENKPNSKELVELEKKVGMSIMSSNGNGKDFLASLITWHFMDTLKLPKVVATANTGQQLRNVYWSEVSKVRGLSLSQPDGSLGHLQTEYVIQSDKMYRKIPREFGEEGKEWFVELVTINAKATPEEQGVSLSGRHASNMLIVVDEASGIPDTVFKPLDRTLTDVMNLVFMIFNPTKNNGFAIDTHHKFKDDWLTLHWDALDCENVNSDQVERLKKYGEDSPAYRIGVLGLPPVSNENALIPYDWIMDAVEREIEPSPFDPVILAADIGGGGDRSCIGSRQGGLVNPLKTSNDRDTMATTALIATEYHAIDAAVAIIDSNGLGAGCADRLREMEFIVHPIYGQGKASREEFFNVRAEMYMNLREQFMNKAISIPSDVELINELGAIKMLITGNKTQIGSKRDIRKALGFSPDKADTLAQLYSIPDAIYRRGGNHYKPLPKRHYGIV